MPDRLSLKHAGAAFLLAVGVFASSPAMAGFQWIAPSEPAAAPPMSPQQDLTPPPSFLQIPPAPAPATNSAPEIISPVIITGDAGPQASQAPQAPSSPPPPPDKGVVQGFARSVPLAVALRQILPSGYAFSIDQDVDMGTLVSFQGGHPWRDTLRDALAPVGLVMHEQGQMVSVGFPAHAPMAATPEPHAPSSSYQAGREPKSLMLPPAASVPLSALSSAPPLDMGMGAGTAAVSQSWNAERGEHLRKILEGWCQRANVEFDWLSEYDYPLQASFTFAGNFESAVRNLLTGFQGAHPQPVAELHSNQALGQMVLVVQTRGNTNSD
jgi:hypothetical protein